MMKELTMYICKTCGNLIVMAENSGVVPECCGSAMMRFSANRFDASAEKHVPVISRTGLRVRVDVGDVPHPMIPAHYIEWIVLLTDRGTYAHYLQPDATPFAEFILEDGERVLDAYACCNLHGLWRSK